jgi:pimeloyl-ACP methyl ester carboxylesterase
MPRITAFAVPRLLIALGILLGTDAPAQSAYRVQEGTINGAHFAIAEPREWNGHLVLVAHGYRPPDSPLMTSLNPEYTPYRTLLSEGWMVAATSYRRNGLIIEDAIGDLDSLRSHISEQYGTPKQILIDGSSMGATIAVLIAETHSGAYQGALARGAALYIDDPREPFRLSSTPQIPLLLLSNQSEIELVRQYAEQSAGAPVVAAVWEIKRDGHVNINSREHEAALRALAQFVETGEIERTRDATIAPPRAVSSAEFRDGGTYGRIREISQSYGNLYTDLVESDLSKLGIIKGSSFTVSHGDDTVTVMLGASYSDVPRGDWIGLFNSEGLLQIARNFENAARTLGCRQGDGLFIRPIEQD